MGPIDIRIDVTEAAPFGSPQHVAAWLFAPATIDPAVRPTVVFCLHGGAYDKRYFHLEVPGHPGYSMAEHLAARGLIVLSLDWLSTSDSSRPDDPSLLTIDNVDAAHHLAVTKIVGQLEAGTLHSSLPPLRNIRTVAVGHSMGGMLAIMQQSRLRSFHQIAVLGYSTLGLNLKPTSLQGVDVGQGYVAAHPSLREQFHLPDVPAEVRRVEAEIDVPVALTLAMQARDTQSVNAAARAIEAPVFVCFGEPDTSPDPHQEAAVYQASPDVTFYWLKGSAHCHNSARTRHLLWDRIISWIPTVT